MQENGLNKFRTIVSEVSYFVGNPVVYLRHLFQVSRSMRKLLLLIIILLAILFTFDLVKSPSLERG